MVLIFVIIEYGRSVSGLFSAPLDKEYDNNITEELPILK